MQRSGKRTKICLFIFYKNRKFHDFLLTMDGRGGWSFSPMDKASISSGKEETVASLSLREEKRDLEKRLSEIQNLLSK